MLPTAFRQYRLLLQYDITRYQEMTLEEAGGTYNHLGSSVLIRVLDGQDGPLRGISPNS